MVPVIKVYEMDYSFIIKNYLNPKLWSKVWTLFDYDDYVITLNMNLIDTIDSVIQFRIKLKNKYSGKEIDGTVSYSINHDRIDMLIKKINGTIFRLIGYYEQIYSICYVDGYANLLEQEDIENEKLYRIANEFLDSEGVTNDDIREAYINSYINNNSQFDVLLRNFKEQHVYHLLTDLYIVFLQSIKDEEKLEIVKRKLEDYELKRVMDRISEYQTYVESEQFEEDMKDNLESI
ncbi:MULTISPECIES: hypothetical protein [Erysipelotrichaceae]|uniref:hypothetical protein n=1 Tax=Erysipelotrichaceae TaxID=128827 RepID=UPI000E4B746C|nr:hypothetical protein [Absiella sp. AM27-20]RHU03297.1 hypothetical protein DW716_15865 [Absiella sp. AM27-20]